MRCFHREYPISWSGWDGFIPNILECSHREYLKFLVWLGLGYFQWCEVFPQGISHIPGGIGMRLFPVFWSVPTGNVPHSWWGWDGVIPKSSHREYFISWHGQDGFIPSILWCSHREYPWLGWVYSKYFGVFPQEMSHIPGGIGTRLFPIFCSVLIENVPHSWQDWDEIIPNILQCSHRRYPCLG